MQLLESEPKWDGTIVLITTCLLTNLDQRKHAAHYFHLLLWKQGSWEWVENFSVFITFNKFDLYTLQESFSNAETSWSMAGPAFKGKIQRKGRWLGEKEDGLLSCSEASPYTLTSWWQWREPDWFTQSPAKEIILLFAGKFLIWQCLEPDLIGEIIQLSIIIRSLPAANKMLRLLVLFYNRYFHRRQGMYLKTLFWNCEGSKIPLHHKHSLETH